MGFPWGVTDYLMAHVIDAVNNVGVGIMKSNGAKGLASPKPFPRPGQEEAKKAIGGREGLTDEQYAAAVAHLRSLANFNPLPDKR